MQSDRKMMNKTKRSLALHFGVLVAGLVLFSTAQAREARRVDGNPDLYERVLTLPGAAMHEATGQGFKPASAGPVPVRRDPGTEISLRPER